MYVTLNTDLLLIDAWTPSELFLDGSSARSDHKVSSAFKVPCAGGSQNILPTFAVPWSVTSNLIRLFEWLETVGLRPLDSTKVCVELRRGDKVLLE